MESSLRPWNQWSRLYITRLSTTKLWLLLQAWRFLAVWRITSTGSSHRLGTSQKSFTGRWGYHLSSGTTTTAPALHSFVRKIPTIIISTSQKRCQGHYPHRWSWNRQIAMGLGDLPRFIFKTRRSLVWRLHRSKDDLAGRLLWRHSVFPIP